MEYYINMISISPTEEDYEEAKQSGSGNLSFLHRHSLFIYSLPDYELVSVCRGRKRFYLRPILFERKYTYNKLISFMELINCHKVNIKTNIRQVKIHNLLN